MYDFEFIDYMNKQIKKRNEEVTKKLISKFVEDLKQITWLIGKAPVDMGFYIKKWEEKLSD